MRELHVRKLPEELHERLRERAHVEGRSMSAQAIVLLGEALGHSGDRSQRQRAAIERLRGISGRSVLAAGAPPAERLVREDRESVG